MRDEDNEQGLSGHSLTLTNPKLRGSEAETGPLGHMPFSESHSIHYCGK